MSIRAQIDAFSVFLVVLLALSLVRIFIGSAAEPGTVPIQGDVRQYHAGVADYFQVPISEVKRAAGTLETLELPVVFFLARYGATGPEEVLEARATGQGWQDVAAELGLGPESFYFPLAAGPDPAFGTAYDPFHDRPRAQWPEIRLRDSDVVSLVNLRFLAEQSGEHPGAVVELRAQGHDFVSIYQYLQQQPQLQAEAQDSPTTSAPG